MLEEYILEPGFLCHNLLIFIITYYKACNKSYYERN
nr:MAG TPA: hypothetical protein [Bacteriophage sp.]